GGRARCRRRGAVGGRTAGGESLGEDDLADLLRGSQGAGGTLAVHEAAVGRGAQTAVDRAERRDVPLLDVLLPPVEARQVPEPEQVVDRDRGARAPRGRVEAVAGDVRRERPQPRAVAV